MFLGFSLNQWLTFGVVGSIISTGGTLAGNLMKDYFFARSLEDWKQKRMIAQVYRKFRDPLLLSSRDLASRVVEILKHYPTVYLHEAVLHLKPERQLANDIDDPYFQRYKLVSTAYRFCALFGWLELFRQEVSFLDPGSAEQSAELERIVEQIRGDFADGQLNTARDWHAWRDTLIFREEIRAIGESMIETRGNSRGIIGYGKFCDQFDTGELSSTKRWISVMLNFLLDLETGRPDFRRERLKRLVVHLTDLISTLDTKPLEPELQMARDQCRGFGGTPAPGQAAA